MCGRKCVFVRVRVREPEHRLAGRGVGPSQAAYCLCQFRGEEWSMCVLSAVVKGKENFPLDAGCWPPQVCCGEGPEEMPRVEWVKPTSGIRRSAQLAGTGVCVT